MYSHIIITLFSIYPCKEYMEKLEMQSEGEERK